MNDFWKKFDTFCSFFGGCSSAGEVFNTIKKEATTRSIWTLLRIQSCLFVFRIMLTMDRLSGFILEGIPREGQFYFHTASLFDTGSRIKFQRLQRFKFILFTWIIPLPAFAYDTNLVSLWAGVRAEWYRYSSYERSSVNLPELLSPLPISRKLKRNSNQQIVRAPLLIYLPGLFSREYESMTSEVCANSRDPVIM